MSPQVRRAAIRAVYASILLVGAPGAYAEDAEEKTESEWVTKWSNGFKVEKGSEFKLKFGGRVMADYTFASADDAIETSYGAEEFENGFEFRRARLFMEGTIYERIKFKAQYDFTGDPDFKDVYIGLLHDFGEVRFGHFKEYFSFEETTSSKYLPFLERSLPVAAFSPSRNSGVGVHGKRGDTFNWGVGAFYDADDFGVSTDEDNVNLTGRVGFRPIYRDKGERLLHLGLSVNHRDRDNSIRFRSRPEAHLTTRLVDTGTFAADSATILGLEAVGMHDRLWWAAEYIRSDVDSFIGDDPTFSGAYVQAGYFLTQDRRRFKTSTAAFDRVKPNRNWTNDGGRGAWEIAARFSSLDLSDGRIEGLEQEDFTLALNWYPNPATRLMINFVNADVEGVGEAQYALIRWQVDF